MSNKENGLQASFARAARRARSQRLLDAAGWMLRVCAAVLLVVLAVVLVFPRVSAWGGIVLGGLAAFFVIVCGVAWFRPLPRGLLARRMDEHAGLADHAITSAELGAGEGGGWLRLQYEDTVARLEAIDWKKAWPLRWPRFSGWAGAVTVLLAALLAGRMWTYQPAPAADERPGLANEAAMIEEVFKDWEMAAELTQDPELKKLLAEIQPMREELPNMNEREMLLSLSKLQNKLEAMREAAAKESMEASASEMAVAFEGMEGMGKLAAAVRQKDFEKAAELAEKEAEKLGKPGAAVPKGADGESTQQKMSAAADKLGQNGQEQASSAMRQMQQAANKKDAQGMCQGMGQMGQSFGKEGQRQQARKNLGTQIAQIGQCKGGLGEGKCEGSGLSLTKKIAEGKNGEGAGSSSDPNREKAATEMGATRTEENLTGQTGEGESMTETLNSETPGSESPRLDRNAQFAQYEKLSEQAIADESLPLAYRETIRKYFEAIRPAREQP